MKLNYVGDNIPNRSQCGPELAVPRSSCQLSETVSDFASVALLRKQAGKVCFQTIHGSFHTAVMFNRSVLPPEGAQFNPNGGFRVKTRPVSCEAHLRQDRLSQKDGPPDELHL